MIVEADFGRAKLDAEAAGDKEKTAEMMHEAELVHEQSRAELKVLRAKLPTTLRKLTAGYELRTY
eukprot:6512005-Prymnesium_polylepis.1